MAAAGSAQSSESSSQPAKPAAQDQPSMSVQARIQKRREQRRAQAIQDAYSHKYEAYLGGGYERFNLSNGLQRATLWSWNGDFTRFLREDLGVTVDVRGNYGTAFLEPKQQVNNISHPAIYQHSGMIGPVYRFYKTPRYALYGRALAGVSYGTYSGDFSGYQVNSTATGLYPDGAVFALNGAALGDYNVTPNFAARLSGEYTLTGYGSSIQANPEFTIGFVYRWGKP